MGKNINDEDDTDLQGLLPASITSTELCSAPDGKPCHILDKLPAYNEILRVVRCRLVERPPDKLSLVSQEKMFDKSATQGARRKACALISCILKNHCCLDSVVLSIDPVSITLEEHQRLIVRSLRMAPALRKLKIYVSSCSLSKVPELSCLSFLTMLETLEFYAFGCTDIAAVLGPLFETTFSLTTIWLIFSNSTSSYEQGLWAALATCKLLNSLNVSFYYGHNQTTDVYTPFIEYLEKTSRLTSVYIVVCSGPARWLKSVLEALYRNKGLINIILTGFIVDTEEAIAIEKFLTEKSSIRNFELRFCSWRNDGATGACYDTDDFGTLTPRILPWLSILKRNQGLQKLRLSFHGFLPAECEAFLEELVASRNLRKVFIEDFQEYCSCSSLRGHRIKNDGKFGAVQNRRAIMKISDCEQIRLDSLYISTPEVLAWFVTASLPLQLGHRVTSLWLDLAYLKLSQESARAIAEFIESTSTLARLAVDFGYSTDDDPKTFPMSEMRRAILRAVHRNASIQDFDLRYPSCSSLVAGQLAGSIRQSKTICCLRLDLNPETVQIFLSQIILEISRNYTLINAYIASIPDLRAAGYENLVDVLVRNRRLVARAAKFTLGSSSPRCAAAMELVSTNPALVNELSELASVDEAEASRMICERLRGLQDLDGFMKSSGVVKQRVLCHMNTSGGLQLDGVDQYSWHGVRKYLRLSDVKD